jgi:hypothetical protein
MLIWCSFIAKWAMQFGNHVLLNTCWRFGVILLLSLCGQFGNTVLLNERWRFGDTLITKHTLAILGTSYGLNRNDRVSSFYKTRGSKLCFLTCFSYFSRYFLILAFLKHCYFFASFSAAWESNFLSHFCTIGTLSWYLIHAPPCFWHRMCGFLKARRSWEPGSRLTTGEFSPFHLLPKVSCVNTHWSNANDTFLTHKKTLNWPFLHDVSPAKLRSTVQVWNPQGISKLVNKVDCQVWYGARVGGSKTLKT